MEPTARKTINQYTRAQALRDKLLIDVSKTAKEIRIDFPIAVTSGVWERHVKVPEGVKDQEEARRLWDILWLFRAETLRTRPKMEGHSYVFKVHVRNDNEEGTPPIVTLRGFCGPGDRGEPVMTIFLLDEN